MLIATRKYIYFKGQWQSRNESWNGGGGVVWGKARDFSHKAIYIECTKPVNLFVLLLALVAESALENYKIPNNWQIEKI